MSKRKVGVHPDYYKTAGERVQDPDVAAMSRRQYAESRSPEIVRPAGNPTVAFPASAAASPARQTSTKSGSRSSAQKTAGVRHAETPVPQAKPVAGAFGRRNSRRRVQPKRSKRRQRS